jgi:TetR/AcrR family transcriptional regulator, regulator of cefoperazone and chloramphenicol sensitivity
MATDDAKTRILNVAGPIFAQKGYEAATVREICDRAGVNLASVNYHFGGKERLYIETVKRAHPITLDENRVPDWPLGTSPETKLRDFISTMMKRMLEVRTAPWQIHLLMREMQQPTAACRELVQGYFRSEFRILLGILDEILPSGTPQHKRHQIGFSVVGQCLHYRMGHHVIAMLVDEEELKEHYGTDQIAQHISEMCLAALGLVPPLAAGCGVVSRQPHLSDKEV